MNRMSWTLSSRGTTLVVLLALAFAAAGTAGALSVSDQTAFNESRVGESVETTVVIEDPFTEQPDQWTLNAETELRNVSWVVTTLDQGEQVNQGTYGGQSFSQNLNVDNGGDEVRIEITGDTPPVENYTYDPVERYTLWRLEAVSGDSTTTLNESQVHHYTNESKEARNAIDSAVETINETGGNSEARSTLNNSISAYDNNNFGNAVDLANEAENQAEQAEQSAQRTQLLIYGAIAVVVVVLVGGGIYYWQSQKDDYGKLQ
jgi:flagellar basal body-associated protein FliL